MDSLFFSPNSIYEKYETKEFCFTDQHMYVYIGIMIVLAAISLGLFIQNMNLKKAQEETEEYVDKVKNICTTLGEDDVEKCIDDVDFVVREAKNKMCPGKEIKQCVLDYANIAKKLEQKVCGDANISTCVTNIKKAAVKAYKDECQDKESLNKCIERLAKDGKS